MERGFHIIRWAPEIDPSTKYPKTITDRDSAFRGNFIMHRIHGTDIFTYI